MWKDIHFHLLHYFFLLSILVAGLVSYLAFSAFPQKQWESVVLTATLYVIWGLAHHHLEGDLYPKIVVEYTLIALLSIILFRGVIFR